MEGVIIEIQNISPYAPNIASHLDGVEQTMSPHLESSSGIEACLEYFDYNTRRYTDKICGIFKTTLNYERTLADRSSRSTENSIDIKGQESVMQHLVKPSV